MLISYHYIMFIFHFFAYPAWINFVKMLGKRFPCWLCPEESCKTQQSRCIFSWIPECYANIDRTYAQMGYQNKTSTGKEILGTVRAFCQRWWRTRQKNTPPTLTNLGGGNHSNIQKCSVWQYHQTRNKARLQQHIYNVVNPSYGPQYCITHKCIGEKDQETLKTGIP